MKKEVSTASQKYYLLTKNLDGYVKAKEIQDTITNKLDTNAQSFITKSYSKFEHENKEIKNSDTVKNIVIVIALVIIITIIILFFSYRKTQKKNIERFREILKKQDQKHNDIIRHNLIEKNTIEEKYEKEDIINSPEVVNIPEETIQKILKKLTEFEKSGLYTSNNITSLSHLAIYCETNTKYLSHVINTYKNKDYNNYINELRIDFIVDKLRNNLKYRNYKIAVLAEEAGFSSHNKFSTVFKKVTTLTPSVFIKYLNENG